MDVAKYPSPPSPTSLSPITPVLTLPPLLRHVPSLPFTPLSFPSCHLLPSFFFFFVTALRPPAQPRFVTLSHLHFISFFFLRWSFHLLSSPSPSKFFFSCLIFSPACSRAIRKFYLIQSLLLTCHLPFSMNITISIHRLLTLHYSIHMTKY